MDPLSTLLLRNSSCPEKERASGPHFAGGDAGTRRAEAANETALCFLGPLVPLSVPGSGRHIKLLCTNSCCGQGCRFLASCGLWAAWLGEWPVPVQTHAGCQRRGLRGCPAPLAGR